MPLYEYLEPGGRVVTRRLAVADRDLYPGRIVVPRTVRVLKPGRSEAEWQAEEVLRGFYREEQKNPRLNDVVRSALGMGPDRVKDVWAEPDAPYAERPGEVVTDL